MECDGPHINFFFQSVHQVLFQEKLKMFMAQDCPRSSTDKEPASLTKDELNAMQYACGYVPHKLLKKYEKRSGNKYSQFVECLGGMAVLSEESSQDLLSYTKCWMEKVDRGCLFPLNNQTFQLFVDIEMIVRDSLPEHVTGKTSDQIDDLVMKVTSNEDVQFMWALLSQDIDSEEDSVELLKDIVKLWITIRGFSIASTWIETYKLANKETKQKSTGLRKHLS